MTNAIQMFFVMGAICILPVLSDVSGWAKNAILSSPVETLLEVTPVPAMAVGLAKAMRGSSMRGSQSSAHPPQTAQILATPNQDAPKLKMRQLPVKGSQNATVTMQTDASGNIKNGKLKTKTVYHLKVPPPAKAQENEQDKDIEAFANTLNAPGHVSVEEVSLNLIRELQDSHQSGKNHSRILKWQTALRPLFVSLEKNAHGNLNQASARYVLHRGFARQHGWYMTGLEPRDTSAGPDSLKQWVPSYLLNLVEELLGTEGINLHELAVLAATFEDLVHKEALGRLTEIYEEKHLAVDGYITEQIADDVIQTYMAMYTSNEDLDNRSAAALEGQPLDLGEAAQEWLREVQKNISAAHLGQTGVHGTSDLDFKATARIIEHVSEEFSTFNNKECKALKSALLEVEDLVHPGQVRLYDFYKKGLEETFWTFDESIEYLRVLGALDESASSPRVIVPNYVSSETNCLTASGFYKSCCRSECEDLMGYLEKVTDPIRRTNPADIANIIAGLPADKSSGPGALSPSLISQLETIAADNGGQVSLHSNAFAQWMHDVFPRECPVPHASKHPQTPDEWLAEHGEEGTRASKEARMDHVDRASYESEQMPWNLDAVAQGQCPIPEAYVPKHTQEEDAVITESQSKRKISLGDALRETEAVTSETHGMWHMYDVSDQTPAAHAERPWHMFEIPNETPALQEHQQDALEPTAVPKAEVNWVLPRSTDVPEKVPDADVLFHQAYDTQSEHEEVVALGKAELPAYHAPAEPASGSTSVFKAFVSGLQNNPLLVFLTVVLSAAVGLEKLSKRNTGLGKRRDDPCYNYGDIDMSLVRMAAAESVSQRYKPSSSQDMV
jgi:hypothetical protein